MSKMQFLFVTTMVFALALLPVFAQNADPRMSFFITSSGPGNGADLGGLAGADRRCQMLARAVGVGNRTWRAYLSTTASGGQAAVNARDRIGSGPWNNSKGVQIAQNVDELHSDGNNLTKETVLNELGQMINGREDSPNRHDILTGSQLDGTAFSGSEDTTCQNWTSHGDGSARVGHHDRTGGHHDRTGGHHDRTGSGQNPTSWNSAHGSHGRPVTRGCSQESLQGTGGDGLFYCFAVD